MSVMECFAAVGQEMNPCSNKG